jgi:hypothetical protein
MVRVTIITEKTKGSWWNSFVDENKMNACWLFNKGIVYLQCNIFIAAIQDLYWQNYKTSKKRKFNLIIFSLVYTVGLFLTVSQDITFQHILIYEKEKNLVCE